jgi:hypothetical protein
VLRNRAGRNDLLAADLAKEKGLKSARVLDKVNQRGELVIAIIIPPSREGKWR